MAGSCRPVPLSRGLVAWVSEEDYERVAAFRWYASPSRARHRPNWYAIRSGRSGESATVYMHRFVIGAERGQIVDHRDRDGLNNRRENLRFCTQLQNCFNSMRPNRSGFRGVYWSAEKRRWYVQIKFDGRVRTLGRFTDKEEAARTYDRAARAAFGEFAALNFPDDLGEAA